MSDIIEIIPAEEPKEPIREPKKKRNWFLLIPEFIFRAIVFGALLIIIGVIYMLLMLIQGKPVIGWKRVVSMVKYAYKTDPDQAKKRVKQFNQTVRHAARNR